MPRVLLVMLMVGISLGLLSGPKSCSSTSTTTTTRSAHAYTRLVLARHRAAEERNKDQKEPLQTYRVRPWLCQEAQGPLCPAHGPADTRSLGRPASQESN